MRVYFVKQDRPIEVDPPAKGQRPRACVQLYQLNEKQVTSKTSDEQSRELIESLATIIKMLE